MNTIPIRQRLTWHNVMLGGSVYAIRRGHWKAAVILMRGRSGCRVKFVDTSNYAFRAYQELAGRHTHKNGADKPADPREPSSKGQDTPARALQ